MDSTSQELPRPPVHGKYDFRSNRPRQRKSEIIKYSIIAIIIIIILSLGVTFAVLFVSFKKAKVPNFQVKSVRVSRFSVANVLTDQQKVLSADVDFFLDSDNKNRLVGVYFGNMVMETGWAGVETTFGETNVRDYVQKSKGVTTLKVSTRSEVEVKMDVKQEDMKLNLSINGDLKFFSGPFKTKRLPFIVSCNNISGVSVHAACGFKLFTNG